MAKSDIRIAVFGFHGCSAWISAGLLEFFAIANVVASARGVRVRFDCHTISATGRTVRASHGVQLRTDKPHRSYHAVVVPPMWAASREELYARVPGLSRYSVFLQRLAQCSRILASACSGAVLLAEAELLDGYRATTCWWLADWFAHRYTAIDVDAAKLVVTDRSRWTAAAGTAYLHLCLELVRKFAGPEIAAAAARLALVEPRRGSQSPFLADAIVAAQEDAPVRKAAQLIERNPASVTGVRDLARRLHTTERTLNRRFHAVFGMAPLVYLQSRRIAHAKRQLEADDTSLDEIVSRCGYSDAASFRKLFAREVGMTPREYRLRFGRSPGRSVTGGRAVR